MEVTFAPAAALNTYQVLWNRFSGDCCCRVQCSFGKKYSQLDGSPDAVWWKTQTYTRDIGQNPHLHPYRLIVQNNLIRDRGVSLASPVWSGRWGVIPAKPFIVSQSQLLSLMTLISWRVNCALCRWLSTSAHKYITHAHIKAHPGAHTEACSLLW